MTQIKSGSAVPADTGIAKIIYIDPTTGEVQESASTTKIQSAAFQTATYELDDTLLGILQDPAPVYSPGPSTLSSRSATGSINSEGSIRSPFGYGFSVPTVSGIFNQVAVPFTSQANDSTSMVLKVYGSADGNPSNSKTLLATAPTLLGTQGGTFASKKTLVPLGVDLTVSSGTYAFLFFDLEFSGSLSNPNEWDGPYAGTGTASVPTYSSSNGGSTWSTATNYDAAFSLDYVVLSSVDKIIQANGSGRLDQSFLQYNINFGSHKLSGVTDPTSAQDAATKNYVDTRTLDDLSDVIITSPTSGQVLQWDGTDWVNGSSLPAIGETITGATAGSVLFAGASGVLAQDNANLFWDDTNNRLGVGTSSPSQPLHVAGSTRGDGDFVSVAGNFQTWDAASPTKAVSLGMNNPGDGATDDFIFSMFSGGWSEKMRLTQAGNLGIGTTSPGQLLQVGSSFTVDSSANAVGHVFSASDHMALTGGDYPRIQSDVADVPLFIGASNVSGSDLALVVAKNGFDNSTNYLVSVAADGTFRAGSDSAANSVSTSGGNTFAGFTVDPTGDLTTINSIAYSWPSAQGSASQVLTNDGSGALSWASPAGINIGTSIGSATEGSVLFAGASGVLAQDNSNFNWNESNPAGGSLGIGTVADAYVKLHVKTADSGGDIRMLLDSPASHVLFLSGNSAGTHGGGTAGNAMLDFASGKDLHFTSSSDTGLTGLSSKMTIRGDNGHVGIGTTAPSELLTVGASHFTVNSSGDITTIRDVAYSWPSAQASQVGQVLSNDGSGNLSWGTVYPQYTIGNAVVVGSPVYVSSANTVSLFDQTGGGLTNEIPGLSMVAGSSGNTTLAFNGTKLSGIASALAGSPTGGAFAAGQRLFVNQAGKLDNAMPTGPSGLVVWQAGILVDSGTIMQVSIKQVKVIS